LPNHPISTPHESYPSIYTQATVIAHKDFNKINIKIQPYL